MNESLMIIVLESLAFWELAGDELVDPDAAEEQAEGAVNELRRLGAEDRAAFAKFVIGYADEEEKQRGPLERIEYFRALPRQLGFV
jgi:hypothetical protein